MTNSNIQLASVEQQQPSIYPVLAQHQREEAWQGQHAIAVLQEWAERFIVAFKLDITLIVLCIDRLPINRLGRFRMGHNGFGLRGEIAINSRYLGKLAPWQILGALLHELLHAWQQEHGTPSGRNHHNREFREKALEFGLIVDRQGATSYAASSVFKDLLSQAGVYVPAGEIGEATRGVTGSSKLVKWSCQCTPTVNVRVAIADFNALCLDCGTKFVNQQRAPSHDESANHNNQLVPRLPLRSEILLPPAAS